MWAEWLLTGLASGRVTTTYPRRREQELAEMRWNSVPVMDIDRRCDDAACEQCAKVCPTEAITRVQEADGPALRLDVSACIACGRCVDQCPEGVFSWGTAVDRAEIRKERFISTAKGGAGR